MPEEIFLLSMFSILAGTGLLVYVISLVASYAKRRQQGTAAEGALRTSELEAMLRRIVREELQRAERFDIYGSDDDPAQSNRRLSRREQLEREQRHLLDEHLDDLDGLDDLDSGLDDELDDDIDETRDVRVRPGGSVGQRQRVR